MRALRHVGFLATDGAGSHGQRTFWTLRLLTYLLTDYGFIQEASNTFFRMTSIHGLKIRL